MEPKTVIFLFFWNFFTLSQKIYTSAAHGDHDKYEVSPLQDKLIRLAQVASQKVVFLSCNTTVSIVIMIHLE